MTSRHTLTGRAANDAVRKNRARLLVAQSEKAERANKIECGQLVPIAPPPNREKVAISTAWGTVSAVMKDRLADALASG